MPALPRQCVILAGGRGSRLGPLTHATPKPLLDVGGRPFLAWAMREALRWGIEDFVLLTGHRADVFEMERDRLAAALPRAATLRLSREPAPAGTGGALGHALPLLDETFLLLNGDSLLLADLGPALAAWARDAADCRMVLRAVADAGRSGVVSLTGDRVTGFPPAAAGPAPGPVLVNAGIYLMRRDVARAASFSLERDVLPGLAARGMVRATVADGWFIDIGVPEDLARARDELAARVRRPALFLDRDGVLNVDHGYVGTIERWQWQPGAIEAVRQATASGYHVFVVTNQSGVGRGFYTEDDVRRLHRWVGQTLRAAGGTLDDVRFCPFHPDAILERYRLRSDWRKPAPGMILDLLRAWDLDVARCRMVGDQPSDLAAAAAAGIAGHLFPGGDLADFVIPLLQ